MAELQPCTPRTNVYCWDRHDAGLGEDWTFKGVKCARTRFDFEQGQFVRVSKVYHFLVMPDRETLERIVQ
jgi:hypothetical protein